MEWTILRLINWTTDYLKKAGGGLCQVGCRLAAAGHSVMLGDVDRQPSLFDLQSDHAFVLALREHRRAHEFKLGLVGLRVREHRLAHEQFHQYLGTLPVPVAGWLRDTQNYVQLAARGLTLRDVAPSRVERDMEQWAPLAAWIA